MPARAMVDAGSAVGSFAAAHTGRQPFFHFAVHSGVSGLNFNTSRQAIMDQSGAATRGLPVEVGRVEACSVVACL